VRHGPTAVFGRLAGHRQQLRDLLRCELARTTWTRRVTQHLFEGAQENGFLLATLDQNQTLKRFPPTPSPATNPMAFDTKLHGDILVVHALEGQKYHASPLGDSLRAGAGTRHGLQRFLLTFRDNDLGSPPWHDGYLPESL
jgi:hypothetical protein